MAASALEKARRHVHGEDVARLTAEAHDRLRQATTLARRSGSSHPASKPRRSA